MLALLLLIPGLAASAQPREIALYPGIAPGSENWNYEEQSAGRPDLPMVRNVVRPVLLYYPAPKSKAVGTAMVVAPGGGFQVLMMSYEGVDIAARLSEMGIDAFVLKYRLIHSGSNRAGDANPQAGQNVPALAIADGQQAIRVVRRHASEFGIRPDRIGMIGFSAGGAVTLGTVFGPKDARPDFAAPIYAPANSMLRYAPADSITPPEGAPPLFLAVAADDQAVGSQASIDLFQQWQRAKLPVELHIFQTGLHGFLKKGGGADHFMDRLEEWMRLNGWLIKPTL
jgi:acetyl esterase/lipase